MDNSMQQYLDELQIKIIDLQEEKFALMNLSKLYPDMIIVYHGKKPYFCTKFINNKVSSLMYIEDRFNVSASSIDSIGFNHSDRPNTINKTAKAMK